MMQAPFTVSIGTDALADLSSFCRQRGLTRLTLVADEHTWPALGDRVAQGLCDAGFDVQVLRLASGEVVADAHRILEVLLAVDETPRIFLAVGSGTITDIVRFVSHRTGSGFVALPTAPSVDGYASVNSPLVIGRFKKTVNAQGPLGIFCDLPTLCAAPQRMIAAGFGDMLGKYTSLADWRLSRDVWGDRYDDDVAAQTRRALQTCVESAGDLGQRHEEGVRRLMEGLIESGLAMLRFRDSRPASGAEHHLSHYWEMRLLMEGRSALLHGAKVGVASVHVARRYAQVRGMSRQEASDRLRATRLPAHDEELAGIRRAFGEAAEQVIAYHKGFLGLTTEVHEALCEKILDRWDAIQCAAREVPPPDELAALLRQVGGPVTVEELGLTAAEGDAAERYAHYLRPRFTVLKLATMLGFL